MVFLDKHGYPVETTVGKWLQNILRLLIHTRSIKRGYWDGYKVINKTKTVCIVIDMYPPMKKDKIGLSFTEPPIKGAFENFGLAVKFTMDNKMDGRWHTVIENIED